MISLPYEIIAEIITYLAHEDIRNLTLIKQFTSISSIIVLETLVVSKFDKDGISILKSPRVIENVKKLTVDCEYTVKLPNEIASMDQLQFLEIDLRFISREMENFSNALVARPFGDLSLTEFIPASNTLKGLTLRLYSSNDIHRDRLILDEIILKLPSLEIFAVVFEQQSKYEQDMEPIIAKLASLPLRGIAVKWEKGSSYDRLRVLYADRFGTLRRVTSKEERLRISSSFFHFGRITNMMD
ncbi:hypothetical protein E3Q02_01541 [Wallemia mellicola]|uniref:F-box domain-containing protein n=1 Tax=Wallemia mellicola TaxID=1708541 RepID=A0AB38MW16_9BASI|nr:hypothetical protein E3Q02_01541 [Wallemia mellicola]